MLQINTGKMFVRKPEYINNLRGVLYTNLRLVGTEKIKTTAGTILAAGSGLDDPAVIYELTEQIEARADGPGVLISHCVEPYAKDFAVVVSFALNVLCTVDFATTERLSSGKPGPAGRYSPRSLIQRFFDERVLCSPEDVDKLCQFTDQLLALERKSFLGAIRAMRTYVVAMHRVADDLELAYTLLVASIESLAQNFDGHKAVWNDVEDQKRIAIDKALTDAPDDVAQKVRLAILDTEHTKLKKRFHDFALSHVTPGFFRKEAPADLRPVGRHDLSEAIEQAYRLRSAYVHTLSQLPWSLTMPNAFCETVLENRVQTLTLQGFARLARHVIGEFVKRQPKLDKEPYKYDLERSGVVLANLPPQYWVGKTTGMRNEDGRVKFEGFLEQITSHLLRREDTVVTDLRDVLRTIEPLLPNMKREQRVPFLALLYCFNYFVRSEDRLVDGIDTFQRFAAELDAPSEESLFVHLLRDTMPYWPLDIHEKVLQKYFHRRKQRSGLRASATLEAASLLAIAERHRCGGDWGRARIFISEAVENLPGHLQLRDFEKAFNGAEFIRWQAILLPARTN